MKQPSDILSIVEALKAAYPEALCSLDYRKDYELPVSYTHLDVYKRQAHPCPRSSG